jgi:hypothetical protein
MVRDKMFEQDGWHNTNGVPNADMTVPLPALYTIGSGGVTTNSHAHPLGGEPINHCGVNIEDYATANSGRMRGPCCEGVDATIETGPHNKRDWCASLTTANTITPAYIAPPRSFAPCAMAIQSARVAACPPLPCLQ